VRVERLSSLDLSFLGLERRDAPMHLGAVLLFRPDAYDPDLAQRLAAVLQARAATVPRLRRRLARPRFGTGAAWVDDPDFDPEQHVRCTALPGPGGRDELATRTVELLAAPLDRDRPLWELHVLAGSTDGSVAVLAKIHYALVDGLLGLALFDDPWNPARHEQPLPGEPPTREVPHAGLGGRLSRTFGGLLAPARPLLDPRTGPRALVRRAGQAHDAARITASIGHSLLRPAPASPLNISLGAARRFATLNAGPAGPARRFAMLRLDLDDVQQVRKAHGGTVNDVLLTVVAGGLRSWLAQRGQPLHRPLRALIPVSRPHPDPADTTGNRLSGYLVELPIDEPNPLQRLHTIRAAMTANKTSGPARGSGAFPMLADLMPSLLHRLAAPIVTPLAAPIASRLFNTVITAVPVPDMLTVAGIRLTEIYPVVPLAAGQALGIAICTYHGVAHIALHANQTAIPDLDRLAHHVAAALAEVHDL
jgi:diacylglycerol O-acyltransferase